MQGLEKQKINIVKDERHYSLISNDLTNLNSILDQRKVGPFMSFR